MLDIMEVESPARTKSHADLGHLQGAWVAVAGRRHARLLIAGHRFTFEIEEGDIYMGTLFLDDEESPRQMDMLIEEGPDHVKGKIALCIYHLDGDVLRWCPTKPGTDKRLQAFPTVDDERYLCLVMKRTARRRPR